MPLVRLRVRVLPREHDAEDMEYTECIKLELVPPGDDAYIDNLEMEDIYGHYLTTAGYPLQARRGKPPNCTFLRRGYGLTSDVYSNAHVIAALIGHDPDLLHQLELFVQDCVHMHLEIWWRTAELATIKRDHGRDMLAQTCTVARTKALGTRMQRHRQHWLWLTLTKPADQLAEGSFGPCLFNATNHGKSSIQGSLKSHGPFGNVHVDNAYAAQAGWPQGWSLHYSKVVECWRDHVADPPLTHKDQSYLHKALHMGTGRCCGELLQAIVMTGAWVPLPIPGSMITDLSLREYVAISELQPRDYQGTVTNRPRSTA